MSYPHLAPTDPVLGVVGDNSDGGITNQSYCAQYDISTNVSSSSPQFPCRLHLNECLEQATLEPDLNLTFRLEFLEGFSTGGSKNSLSPTQSTCRPQASHADYSTSKIRYIITKRQLKVETVVAVRKFCCSVC